MTEQPAPGASSAQLGADLAIVNGQVVDPERGEVFPADLAVRAGRIAGISRQRGAFQAGRLLDAAGAYITPALVDCHVHCFQHVSPGSLDPDRIGIGQGVGAIIDAGSFGPRNAAGFVHYVARPVTTRVFGLVNISRWGNASHPGEGEDAGFLQPDEAVRAIAQFPEQLRGIKVRASATAAGALGIRSTQLAKEAAQAAGVPLMVHIGNAPPRLEEVCDLLTAGDVITHCFHGKPGGAVTEQGEVLPALRAALERGVLLDIGHGSASFAWATAERALALGLRPHSISTDLHRGCVRAVPGKSSAISLVAVMSRLLQLGLPLLEVVRAATLAPARAFGLTPQFGVLREGGPANLSLLALVERPEELFDADGQRRRVERGIEARAVLLSGEVHAVNHASPV